MRPDDFERLFDEHAQPLFGFLAYRTGDRVLAEDLVSETFERAFKARSRFDRRKARESTWLYSIALNLLRDHNRRSGVAARALEREPHVLAGAPASDPLAAVEDRDSMERALAALAPEEREAVALRYGADLTVPEIAKVLDLPLTTAEGRIYRALRKLREQLS